MKTISKSATVLFLATMIAISLAPAFASASDPSDPPAPAIYFDHSILVGRPVTVTGVGFTPSATITFTCGNQLLQTVPNPAVADSSGGFTVLLMTNNLGDGSCAITATDGKTTAQEMLTIYVNDHDKEQPPPSPPACDTRNTLSNCCEESNPHGIDVTCCAVSNLHGLDEPCGTAVTSIPPTLDRTGLQIAGSRVSIN